MFRIVCDFFNPGSLSGHASLSDLEFPTEHSIETFMETTFASDTEIGQRFYNELHGVQEVYPHMFHGSGNTFGLPQAHRITSVTPGEYIMCPSTISNPLTSIHKGFRFVLLFSDVTVKFDERLIDLARGDMFICTHLPGMYSREGTFGLLEIYIITESLV
jgi:hypothetical protein